tara:strand:+ start:592 stop:1164 length:573 start_codon:yes stop_codon:yes gene_type:complete
VSATTESAQHLPLLLERVQQRSRFTVFDIGPATPQTVAFFSNFKCRLHFADLYDDPLLTAQDELEDAELLECFKALLSFAVGPFDLCLLWDAPNYLNPRALRALSDALRPLIQHQSVAHGYCAFQETQPFAPKQYGILDAETVSVAPRPKAQARMYPTTQNALIEAFSFFTVGRGTLMSDGRVELLLEAL